jgi:hypothetical protein
MGGQSDVNWNHLLGERVQIHQGGRFVRAGYVEDVTYSADALWLQGHGTEPRALYLKADGFTAKVVAEAAGETVDVC